MIKEYVKITKYSTGSLKELFYITFPVMLTLLSNYLMIFIDRLILANYSLEAMNAVTSASLFCMIFQSGIVGIVSIAEVFVGQYNGSEKYFLVKSPVWQMIWFSLMLFPVFFLLANFLGPIVLSDYHYRDFAFPYFQWLFYFMITFGVQTALSAFFVGIGKVRVVTVVTIVANLINVLLDFILIFGIKNVFSSMGTKGAAIATGISQIFQILILLIFFLSKKNRRKFCTQQITFELKLILKCLKIGFPSALGHMIEITALALIIRITASLGEDFLTVIAISQNIYAAIVFSICGLQKAVIIISSNLIGSGNYKEIQNTCFSATKLLFIFAAVVSLILLIYPDFLIKAFLRNDSCLYNIENIRVICVFLWIYFILDGLTWIFGSVLIAAGDTSFTMLVNVVGIWFLAFLPIYLYSKFNPSNPAFVWFFINFYALLNMVCFYLRYRFISAEKLNKIT